MVYQFSCLGEDGSAACQLNVKLGHLVLNFHVPSEISCVPELDPTTFVTDHSGLGLARVFVYYGFVGEREGCNLGQRLVAER